MEEKNKLKQKTSSGIVVSGVRSIEQNEEDSLDFNTLYQDFYKMRNGDSIASISLQILKLPLLSVGFRIEGENQELNDFIKYQFKNLYKGFSYFLRHCLISLDYGFVLFEKVWERGVNYKGKICNMIRKLVPIYPLTIEEFYFDDYGEFIRIKHRKKYPDGSFDFVDLDKNELLEMVWDEEFFDIRGRSLLRPSRIFWRAKQDVLIGTTRAKVRGAGIPKITLKKKDEDIQSRAISIGSTLANSVNSYVIQGEDEMNVELLQLQNQNDNVEFLQYLDRQQFFNTLTQFMTSGIGENGSRAATEAHKSPYEIFINNIASWLENRINEELIVDMINNSSFLINVNEEPPKFKLNLPKMIDIESVSRALYQLVIAKGIHLTEKDEIYLRQIFGLPDVSEEEIKERNIKEEEVNQDEVNAPEIIEEHNEEEHKHLVEENLLLEISKLNLSKMSSKAKEVFELENAVKVHNEIREQVSRVVKFYHKKIIEDIVDQIENSDENKFRIKYKKQLLNNIRKFYRKAYIEGRNDAKKEIAKLHSRVFEITLTDEEDIKEELEMLGLKIEVYFNDLEKVVKSLLLTHPIKKMKDKGELKEWLSKKLIDAVKRDQTNMVTFAGSGYTKGRNDEFLESEEVEMFEYTAVMDNFTCENCAPYDGLVMTKQELLESGLNFAETNGNLNPDCLGLLGGNVCRCQLVPVK